jgi:putative DNA primase/helicase
VFGNGNNTTVAADLVRRAVRAGLDANSENPETRTFKNKPLEMARKDRGKYVAACLTVCRAYIVAGYPERLPPFESYESWSDIVRSPLVWLGYADPVATMETSRSLDPIREDRAAVFAAWRAELKADEKYLAATIAELAGERYPYDQSFVRPTLRTALLAIAAQHGDSSQIDARRLGLWLKKHENTIALGHKLTADRADRERPRWAIKQKAE